MELGDVTAVRRTTSNKSPVPRPTTFFDAAHMDIAYGNVVAPGGIKFALIIVDRETRYTYVLPLKNCQSQSIITVLKQLMIMAGKLPTSLYTDLDTKLLSSSVLTFCTEHDTMIIAAPSEQQNQNGLVKRTWQTLSQMARAFVTDKHMPRSYWFWAI